MKTCIYFAAVRFSFSFEIFFIRRWFNIESFLRYISNFILHSYSMLSKFSFIKTFNIIHSIWEALYT